MSEELATLKKIESLLKNLVKVSLSTAIEKHLTDERLWDLYTNTGKLTRGELERQSGFSGGKISGLWQAWEQAGLLIKEGKAYRKPFE
jgi:hypothetical protein